MVRRAVSILVKSKNNPQVILNWIFSGIFTALCILSFPMYSSEIHANPIGDLPQNVVVEGILAEMQVRRTTKHADEKEDVKLEKRFVVIPDAPIVLRRSIIMAGSEMILQQKSLPSLLINMSDEFVSLIGKRVRIEGELEKPFDFFFHDEAQLNVNTILDCEWIKSHQPKVFSYEPAVVALTGKIYNTTRPGPPEYLSIEQGDAPETSLILALKEPIDVGHKDDPEIDDFNTFEQGVREIQLVFLKDEPPQNAFNREIVVSGSLFHQHTAHHRRRILMMVNDWE